MGVVRCSPAASPHPAWEGQSLGTKGLQVDVSHRKQRKQKKLEDTDSVLSKSECS